MPISDDYEFTFGGVPCLVVTSTGSRPTAQVYVIVRDGRTVRPLVDNGGRRVEFVGYTGGDDALHRALDYLETRFGARSPARHWNHANRQMHVWTVLHESPVRPDDAIQ